MVEFARWRKEKRSDAGDIIELPVSWRSVLCPATFYFYAIVLHLNRDVFWKFQYSFRRGRDGERLAKMRDKNMLPHIKAMRQAGWQARYYGDPNYRARSNRMGVEYFKANKAKVYAYRASRPDIYKKAMREYVRVWQRERRHNDPNYRLGNRLRSRLWHALRDNAKKAAKTMELVGCTIGELRQHLESKFVVGMSWSNIGMWHIDHIRPCASFDLSDPAQQRACFHYTNLQPLWERDNLAKGDSLIFPLASVGDGSTLAPCVTSRS